MLECGKHVLAYLFIIFSFATTALSHGLAILMADEITKATTKPLTAKKVLPTVSCAAYAATRPTPRIITNTNAENKLFLFILYILFVDDQSLWSINSDTQNPIDASNMNPSNFPPERMFVVAKFLYC